MNKIQQAFNRAAETYDQHCEIQRHAGMKLTTILKPQHPRAKNLLDLGCGTGLNTQFLASQFEYQHFHAIDLSSALLAKAKTRLNKLNIKTAEMNFDHLCGLNPSFDIIYSNMSLQWSADIYSCLNKLRSFLEEDAVLAFSLPLPGTFKEVKNHCSVNDFTDHEQICSNLKLCGYALLSEEKESITLSFPDALSALQSIKQIGANHVHDRSHKGLRSRTWFTKLTLNSLTYEIGYYTARKL